MADGQAMTIPMPAPPVSITGPANVLAQVRLEVAQAIRSVAFSEMDPRVISRLHIVAAMVAQQLSQAEAEKTIAEAAEAAAARTKAG